MSFAWQAARAARCRRARTHGTPVDTNGFQRTRRSSKAVTDITAKVPVRFPGHGRCGRFAASGAYRRSLDRSPARNIESGGSCRCQQIADEATFVISMKVVAGEQGRIRHGNDATSIISGPVIVEPRLHVRPTPQR